MSTQRSTFESVVKLVFKEIVGGYIQFDVLAWETMYSLVCFNPFLNQLL